jgi:hypothetical protein
MGDFKSKVKAKAKTKVRLDTTRLRKQMETLITALERKLTHDEVFLRKLEVFAEKAEGGDDLSWETGESRRCLSILMWELKELRKVLHSDAGKNAGADPRLTGEE